MNTININGKEYTKEDFLKKIYTVPSISGLFENLNNFPRHEPAPPTVRPMSELPEIEQQVVFKVVNKIKNTWEFGVGWVFDKDAITVNSQTYFLNKEYSTKWSKTKLEGWLPLPNPNDIEL